jgi:hypothetical protein
VLFYEHKAHIRFLPRQQIAKRGKVAEQTHLFRLNLLAIVFRLTQRFLEDKESQRPEFSDMHSLSAHRLRAFVR